MRKTFALWILLLATCLTMTAQQVPTFLMQQYADLSIVNQLSDNGKWAIVKGATTEQRMNGSIRILNTETKEETLLKTLGETEAKGKYVANDITDDGRLVVGAYNGTFTDDGSYLGGQPAVFDIDSKIWTALPMPKGYNSGYVNSVTPDGKWAVGFCEDNAMDVMNSNSTGVMWNLEKMEVANLENLPQMPIDYNVKQETYSGISADGRFIVIYGNQSIRPTAFLYDVQHSTSVRIGVDGHNAPAQFLQIEMCPTVSANGKYVTCSIRNTNDEVYVIRYDTETQTYHNFSSLEEQDMFAGHVDNDGNVYASSPTGTPLRDWKVMNDNIWYPFALILEQRYHIDFSKSTGFENTGTMWTGSADGTVLGPMVSPQGESYIVRMPETMSQTCQGIDLLQDYTASPTPNAAFHSMEKVTLRFAQPIQVLGGSASAILKDANGNIVRNSIGFKEVATDNHSLIVTFRATSLTDGAAYHVVIPAGTLALAANAAKTNREIVVSYIGRDNVPVSVTKIFPEDGAELSRIDNTSIFPVLTFDCDVKVTDDAKASLIETTEDGNETHIADLFVLPHSSDNKSVGLLPRTTQYLYKGATYKVVVEPGAVTDVMGNVKTANETLSVRYVGSYERAVSSDNATLFAENFDNIAMSLANMMRYEGDHRKPTEAMAAMEFDADNQPWNLSIRETLESTDICAGSHSMYSPAGQSDDWMVTPQLYIPDACCTLTFDAQKYKNDKNDRLKVVIWSCNENLNVLSTAVIDRMKAEGQISVFELESGKTEEGLAGDWKRYAIDLADFAGKKVYIGFWNDNEDESMVFVDNILVMRSLKYLMAFSNKDVVIAQKDITISGKLTVNDDIATYSNITLTLNDNQGNSLATFTQQGTFGKNDIIDFAFDTKLPLTIGEINEYSITVKLDDYTDQKRNFVQNLSFEPVKRVVLEEMTGTTCPNCPRGILAIENLEKIFGDRFIPISYHCYTGDPYSTGLLEDYCRTMGLVAAPSGMVQRNGYICSPIGYDDNERNVFSNGIDLWQDIVSMEMDVPTYIRVNVPKIDIDDQNSTIVMTLEIESALNMKNQYINVFPVALEDGLVNIQMNNLYNYEDEIFGEWGKGGAYSKPAIGGFVHNDVVRTYWGEISGTSVGFPQTLEAGTTYTQELRLSYPANVSVRENGKIVLMIMEGNEGIFLNAITVPFKNHTGINHITSDSNDNITFLSNNGTVEAAANGKIRLELYTASGQLIGSAQTEGKASVSLHGYKGIVIAKAATSKAEAYRKMIF